MNVTRLLLTRPEAEALIQEIPQIKEMTVANDKQREERYKEALKTCDCRVWVSMIKALYLRKQDRIEHKKKVTDLDERYFRMAEDYLNSELSLALDISKEKINEYIKERIMGDANGGLQNSINEKAIKQCRISDIEGAIRRAREENKQISGRVKVHNRIGF